MTRAWLAILALAGCDRVFGLHEQDAPGANAVLGTYELRRLVDAPDGASLVLHQIPPASRLTFAATLDDGSTADVGYDDATGTIAFELAQPGQAYRLQRSLDGVAVEYQLAAPTIHLADAIVGRDDAISVTVPTPVTFDTGTQLPGHYVMVTTGMLGQLDLGTIPAPFTVDWNATLPGGGRLSLLDGGKGDVVYVVRFTDSTSTPVYAAVTSALRASPTLVNGSPPTVTGVLTTAPPICATITAHNASEDARLLAQVPDTYDAYAGDVRAFALPAPEVGVVGPLQLSAALETTPVDLRTTQTFIDPFAGTTPVASLGVERDREVSIAGAASVRVPVGIRYFAPLTRSGDCTANQAIASGTLGYAKFPTLAGQLLDHDATVAVPSGDAVVTWPTDLPVDVTAMSLNEVEVKNGTTTITHLSTYVTTGNQLTIRAGSLSSGHSYIFRFDTSIGLVDAKDGDFRVVQYPTGNATTWSHVATIQ